MFFTKTNTIDIKYVTKISAGDDHIFLLTDENYLYS